MTEAPRNYCSKTKNFSGKTSEKFRPDICESKGKYANCLQDGNFSVGLVLFPINSS